MSFTTHWLSTQKPHRGKIWANWRCKNIYIFNVNLHDFDKSICSLNEVFASKSNTNRNPTKSLIYFENKMKKKLFLKISINSQVWLFLIRYVSNSRVYRKICHLSVLYLHPLELSHHCVFRCSNTQCCQAISRHNGDYNLGHYQRLCTIIHDPMMSSKMVEKIQDLSESHHTSQCQERKSCPSKSYRGIARWLHGWRGIK